MTALQIEFNKLREQQRANLAQEAIKAQDAESNRIKANAAELEASLKEMKAPAEIQSLVSDASRNDAQTKSLIAGLDKIQAEVANIKQQTGLTAVEKERQSVALQDDLISLIHRTTGIMPPGDMIDTINDWIGKLLGGGAKTIVGSLIG